MATRAGEAQPRPSSSRGDLKIDWWPGQWLRAEKQAGRPVATPYFLLDDYADTLNGRPPRWSCRAGEKCFYVSPQGQFHFCYHVPPAADFASVSAADLARWAGPKGCERACGVDCVIHTSMPYSSTAAVAASEGWGRLEAAVKAVRLRLPVWGAEGDVAPLVPRQ